MTTWKANQSVTSTTAHVEDRPLDAYDTSGSSPPEENLLSESGVTEERLLTARDVASFLGVHENYVYARAASGEIPSYKFGSVRRFRRHDIDAWLESSRSTGASRMEVPG